jgi:hypothetical protein
MMLPARHYVSDHTRFIRELQASKPALAQDQQTGRAIWWDKELDREELKRQQAARVPQQGYVYQTQAKK